MGVAHPRPHRKRVVLHPHRTIGIGRRPGALPQRRRRGRRRQALLISSHDVTTAAALAIPPDFAALPRMILAPFAPMTSTITGGRTVPPARRNARSSPTPSRQRMEPPFSKEAWRTRPRRHFVLLHRGRRRGRAACRSGVGGPLVAAPCRTQSARRNEHAQLAAEPRAAKALKPRQLRRRQIALQVEFRRRGSRAAAPRRSGPRSCCRHRRTRRLRCLDAGSKPTTMPLFCRSPRFEPKTPPETTPRPSSGCYPRPRRRSARLARTRDYCSPVMSASSILEPSAAGGGASIIVDVHGVAPAPARRAPPTRRGRGRGRPALRRGLWRAAAAAVGPTRR